MTRFFHDATVTYQGRVLTFYGEEGGALEEPWWFDWYPKGVFPPFLEITTSKAIRRKYKEVPQQIILELGSQALGITLEVFISALRGHENFMLAHEGDPTYHVLDDQ